LILFFGAHPDDVELGCGGYLSTLRDDEAAVVTFSMCPDVSENLENEWNSSLDILNVCKWLRFKYDLTNKHMDSDGEKIRVIMEQLKIRFKLPGIEAVYVPCSEDMHQDHNAVYREAIKVFKSCSVFGYIQPWNCRVEPYDVFIPIRSTALDKKIEALDSYASQGGRLYIKPEKIRGLAEHVGWKVGVEYAEGFECIRYVKK